MLPRAAVIMLLLSLQGAGTAQAQLSLDQLVYNHGGANSTNRSLSDVLRERISVRDFGALGKCGSPDVAPSQPTDENCPDDTAAFLAAFAWATEPFNQITVHVPPGSYRIDGTIAVHASELVLSAGAVLRRVNLTGNTDPIVRLGYQGRLSGTGTLTTMNPSPRGVVNIGPANLTIYENVEYAQVSGIHIQGAGLSWSIMKPNEPVDKRLEGSRGLCFDSSEGYARTHMCQYVPELPGCINHTVGGGACYQNTVRDIQVSDIDVGVYMGPEVNGNQVSNVMMIGMGQASYFMDGPNGENTISGGFTAGFGGNLTVIKARRSAYNYFMSVQSEPGRNSTYFDFDENSLWNTVIGQDDTFDQSEFCPIIPEGGDPSMCAGPTVRDPNFIYMQHGQLHIGDFNTTVESAGAPPRLEWNYQLQVEGEGYIRKLSHGFPHRKHGLKAKVEAVEDEPVLVTSTALHTLSISNLSLSTAGKMEGLRAGAFFEVSISGAALGPPDCNNLCALAGKFMLVPIAHQQQLGGQPQLHAKSLAGDGDGGVALLGGQSVWEDGEVLFALPRAVERDLVVEVRRAGRPCTTPVVSLV